MRLQLLLGLLAPLAARSLAAPSSYSTNACPATPTCRCFPGDRCWPSRDDWSRFNRTVGGRLIATIPIGAPCHNSQYGQYDAAKCTQLKSVWGMPETHIDTSSSVMAPFAQNQSCDPFLPPTAQCVIGNYVQYSVKAGSVLDIQKTLEFAQKRNIRFAIRNTGHDYFGKSGGAGALAIWTHFLKDIQVKDYHSPSYSGKAIKVGSGVQAGEAQEAAHKQGLVVVGGNSPSVGLAGGYSQGGGHGPLASYLGLGADRVLEWEVVTGTGKFLTASPSQNSDLFSALAGGGGGTYGIVTSMTVKASPDTHIAGANLTFSNAGVSQETYYQVVQTFLTSLPPLLDDKAVAIFLLTNTTFLLQPVTAPGMNKAKLQAYLDPTLNALKKNKMPYQYFINDFPTYLDSYQALNPEPQVTEFSIGGRLIPRSLVTSNSSTSQLTQALRFINDNGGVVSGLCVNVQRFGKSPPNSVNPAWRDAFFDAVVGVPWVRGAPLSQNLQGQKLVTNVLLPQLEKLSPGGGAYVNEGDPNQADFQRDFYGAAYGQLRSVKNKYDPHSTFYGLTAVGSECWRQQSDGRLCRAQ